MDQEAKGRLIRRAAWSTGISLRRLAQDARIPYPRMLRLVAGERRAKPGELELVCELLRRRLATETDASEAIGGGRG